MRRILLSASLLLAFSSPLMASPIYQWVDSDGQSHFGAQPPQGVESTLVNTGTGSGTGKPKPKPSPVPAATTQAPAGDSQNAIDAKVKQDVAKQQAELKQYCDLLRTNLAQLENNPRVMVEENGESRRLGEDQRQAKIAETQKAIAKDCD